MENKKQNLEKRKELLSLWVKETEADYKKYERLIVSVETAKGKIVYAKTMKKIEENLESEETKEWKKWLKSQHKLLPSKWDVMIGKQEKKLKEKQQELEEHTEYLKESTKDWFAKHGL